jgi:hypothetical protein
MARLRFRDRFFSPPVARAMTSPLGILLAGGGAAVGILLGGGIPLAIGLGAAAWAGRVATAIPRGDRPESINPFSLNDPWRGFVQDALSARDQFRSAVRSAPSGPMRDRLTEIGDRVEDGVQECWRVARRGQQLADARRRIDTTQSQAELAEITAGGRDASPELAGTLEAIEAQLASAQRLEQVTVNARDRLRLLNARLDEAVARAVELSVQSGDTTGLAGLGQDVDSLVTDMEALRQGLEAVSGPSGSAAATG